ncbi:MAG: phosphotransferase, partial [Vicinamibacterales bacterium]
APSGARNASTQPHRDRAVEQLGVLAGCRAISIGLRESLQEELRRNDPGESPQTLVHLDYCPPNIVLDAAGALHVVDNEWIRLEAPGLDLGRTYARWAADEDAWGRFMRGYATTSRVDPGPLRFWMIAMAARGAVIRLQRPPAARAVPMARLHELAAVPQG